MKSTFIVILMVLVSLTKGFNQVSTISGQLTDATTKEYVIGAQVILNGGMFQTITNTTGQYAFENIAPGTYQLTIQFIGYENDTMFIDCSDSQNKTLNQTLQPAAFQLEAIQVTAEPEMQTESISAVDIQLRSINTSQDVLRMVPGLFIAQHAGGGKAEQIFLRGFDIDHGTDIAITTDNMPVNMVSHAHGQGYADLHYLIPETVDKVHFGKGPYHTHVGNLATAGYVGFQTLNVLDENQQ